MRHGRQFNLCEIRAAIAVRDTVLTKISTRCVDLKTNMSPFYLNTVIFSESSGSCH